MHELVERLRYVLGENAARKAVGLFVLMLLGAVFEAVGIGLILPFVALLADPGSIGDHRILRWMQATFEFGSPKEMLLVCGVALLVVYVAKNVYLYFMYSAQYRFVFSQQVVLMRRLLGTYLGSPYVFHLQRNSSELVRNLTTEVSNCFNRLLVPMFTFLVELLVVVVIAGLLLLVDPLVTISSIAVLGIAGAGFYWVVRARMLELGQTQQRYAATLIKWIHQGVGGIKESKVLGREGYFIDNFEESSTAYAGASRAVSVTQITPRFFIEVLGMGAILTALLVVTARGQGVQHSLPVLGMFGMAAVRLMPSSTRLVASLTAMRGARPSLDVLYEDLHALADASSEPPEFEEIELRDQLELRDVVYQYPGADAPTIRGLDLSIKRGESVAFVGSSGAGKTTTVDIILGLLVPKSGEVLVDGRSIQEIMPGWQRRIGYIAQPTYLMDESLRRNVAFGIPDDEIDDERVWTALTAARLDEHVRSLPDGLDTVVGELGTRMSGGQRQRIGIARALYHDPDVLVLDEATSALDNATEQEITRTIAALKGGRTIVTIAHRLSTIEDCDRLFFLRDGELAGVGTFDELLADSPEFRTMTQRERAGETS